jgi:hypothetical protein
MQMARSFVKIPDLSTAPFTREKEVGERGVQKMKYRFICNNASQL